MIKPDLAYLLYMNDKVIKKLTNRSYKAPPRRYLSIERFLRELKNEPKRNSDPCLIFSVDDTSLKTKNMSCSDNGGDANGEVRKFISRFIEIDLRPTIYFVPNPRYAYLSDVKRSIITNDFDVSSNPNNEFLLWLANLEKQEYLEVCVHGYQHLNKELNGYHSFEFDGISRKKISEKLAKGWESLNKHFSIKGFKPPAWSIGNLCNNRLEFLDTLNSFGKFKYVSLSSPSNGLNYSKKVVSHIHKEQVLELENIPQNLSILWEWEDMKKVVDQIILKGGIINLQLHSQKAFKFLTDGFDEVIFKKTKKLRDYVGSFGIDCGLSSRT